MKSEKITLYFKQTDADKIYTASLEAIDNGGFVVNVAYGDRGSTLTIGTKTKTPVNYEAAKKIYDTLVKRKTAKGYSPSEQEAQYLHPKC